MKSINYSSVEIKNNSTIKTGNENFDEFLSSDGGFIEKSAIFLTGTPGAGKTTLSCFLQKQLLNVKTCFYSREMTAYGVKKLTKRFGEMHNNAFIADKESCANINSFINELDELMPKVVIIDSLQVILKEDYPNQSSDSADFQMILNLRHWTDKHDAVLIVVVHVNKDGDFEGKNTIQHMFDAHMEMIFDKKKNSRTLSWAKNRYGTTSNYLYYEFKEKDISFFTKDQYSILKNNKKIEEYISEVAFVFIDSIDKNNLNYPNFMNEFCKKMDELNESNKNLFETNIEILVVIKKLLSKYKL